MNASTRHAARSLLLFLVLVALALAPSAYAQTTFATDLDFVIGLTQLDDERILVVQGGESGNVLAFDLDGTALPNFASDIAGPGDVTQLSDGRVLLSTFANQNVLAFASDGTPLPSFAEGLVGAALPTQLDDGRVLVAELFAGNVVAFNADGTGRTAFVSDLNFPNQIVQLQDGRVLVAVALPSGGLILAFNPDGTALPDFATVDFPVGAMTQLDDGRVLVAQGISGAINAFDPDGTALPDFGTADPNPRAMTQLADRRVLVTDQAGTVLAFEVDTTPSAFAQIQRFPGTPERFNVIENTRAYDIVEMPNGSLGLIWSQEDENFGPDSLLLSTSVDGTTWSEPQLLDQAAGNQSIQGLHATADAMTGRVVALYNNFSSGGARILYSDDGETWTNVAAPSVFDEVNLTDLAPVPGGGFAAVMQTFPGGDFGPSVVTTSADGLTWGSRLPFTEEFDNGVNLCSWSVVPTGPTDLLVLYSECQGDQGTPWPIRQVSSADGGATWSEPVTAITSELPFGLGPRMDAMRAGDGTLWMVHSKDEQLAYTSSTDGGATWAESEQWTFTTGADREPRMNTYGGEPMAMFLGQRPEVELEAIYFYYGIPGVSQDPLNVAAEPTSEGVPHGLALAQNYPNPFASTSTIPFAVTTTAPTTLLVYDLLGREVARLVDETLAPGSYEARFDAADLASGVYLYRLVTGSASTQRRLTVVR
ncbi:MAG: T9SS type A sorting domain-containing protein [Bacteroidota bacterium]